jgi:hypothetical protein
MSEQPPDIETTETTVAQVSHDLAVTELVVNYNLVEDAYK